MYECVRVCVVPLSRVSLTVCRHFTVTIASSDGKQPTVIHNIGVGSVEERMRPLLEQRRPEG